MKITEATLWQVPGINSALTERKSKSIPPSFFVRNTRIYLAWSNVNFCSNCGIRGKCEDLSAIDPCPECGERKIREYTGKWVNSYWLLKGEDEAEVNSDSPSILQNTNTKSEAPKNASTFTVITHIALLLIGVLIGVVI